MNKSSVVVDGHTVSYWKYQLINKLYTENNLEKIYITNHDDFSLVLSLNRIAVSYTHLTLPTTPYV